MSLMTPECPQRGGLEHQVRKGWNETDSHPHSVQWPLTSLRSTTIPEMVLVRTRTATAHKSRVVFQQDPSSEETVTFGTAMDNIGIILYGGEKNEIRLGAFLPCDKNSQQKGVPSW